MFIESAKAKKAIDVFGSNTSIEKRIEKWIDDMKSRGVRGTTIKTRIDVIKLFYDMNRIAIAWKIIFKMLPKQIRLKDQGWSREQLQKMLTTAKIREQALIPLLATLDMGKCILCGRCQEVSPELFKVESMFVPSTKKRQDLIKSVFSEIALTENKLYEKMGKELKDKVSKILGRSLAVREVDAGSCNGCEVEITALNNPIYDIERFGIHFVASPRHADVLLVTGPHRGTWKWRSEEHTKQHRIQR